MKDLKACFSRNTDDWKTPKILYDKLMALGFIDCFLFHSKSNEFENDYYKKDLFVNPPYSKMKDVCPWLVRQIKNGNCIYLLIPARTDTRYFHLLLNFELFIYFFKGRLHFNESKSAPFPSILLIFNERSYWIYGSGSIEEFVCTLP